jgi:hypothetical protein
MEQPTSTGETSAEEIIAYDRDGNPILPRSDNPTSTSEN